MSYDSNYMINHGEFAAFNPDDLSFTGGNSHAPLSPGILNGTSKQPGNTTRDDPQDAEMKKFVKTLLEHLGLLTETTTMQTQQSQEGFQGIRRHLQSIHSAVGDVKQVLKELQELRLEVTALKNQLDEKKQLDESNSLQRYYRPNQSPFRANSGYLSGQANDTYYAGSQPRDNFLREKILLMLEKAGI